MEVRVSPLIRRARRAYVPPRWRRTASAPRTDASPRPPPTPPPRPPRAPGTLRALIPASSEAAAAEFPFRRTLGPCLRDAAPSPPPPPPANFRPARAPSAAPSLRPSSKDRASNEASRSPNAPPMRVSRSVVIAVPVPAMGTSEVSNTSAGGGPRPARIWALRREGVEPVPAEAGLDEERELVRGPAEEIHEQEGEQKPRDSLHARAPPALLRPAAPRPASARATRAGDDFPGRARIQLPLRGVLRGVARRARGRPRPGRPALEPIAAAVLRGGNLEGRDGRSASLGELTHDDGSDLALTTKDEHRTRQ